MQEVWFLFKLLEAIFGILSMNYHVLGFLHYEEPLPHNLFYCGTFSGFTLMALFGSFGICVGVSPTAEFEAFLSSIAAMMHIGASMLSMYHAENDFHLWYLSDFEEPKHPFFHYCKAQSISALICGSLYLLNAVLAFDALILSRGSMWVPDVSDDDVSIIEEDDTALLPIKMYVCGKRAHRFLEKFQWFRRLEGLPVPRSASMVRGGRV